MKAFIYCRFSSHKQQELSIEGQRDICLEYARNHNITVLGEYVDRAKSARTENRAEFRRLIRDAETGVVDCVLVWRYDRFFRDRAESALYRRQLEAAGVRLISVTEFIPEGSAGVITQGMIETVAEYFSAKLSEDVSRGMTKAAQHCQITGSTPLGYRPGPDKRWRIDPVGADIVRRIYETYASGQSMTQLVETLNKEGYKTSRGTPFTKSSFTKILRNKKYIGIYEYNGEVCIDGGIPRILDDDLFFAVQRKLEANRHRPGAYKAEVPYYLSGKLFCGECGAPMTGSSGTSRRGIRHHYYICNNRRAKKCQKKNERLDTIENTVFDAALSVLTDETIAYIATEVEHRCAEHSGAQAILDSLKMQLADVENTIQNFARAIGMGIITETTKTKLMEAEADRENLREKIEQAALQMKLEVKAEAVACWLDGFRNRDRNDPALRRDVFGALIHSVFVYDDKLKIIFTTDKSKTVIIPTTKASSPTGSDVECFGVPNDANTNTPIFFIWDTFGVCVNR